VGLLLTAGPLVAQAPGGLDDLQLIGNATGVETIGRTELRRIFRGERTVWSSGTAVQVVLPSSRAPFAATVSRAALDMTPTAMQRYWLALVFQGRARPPVSVDSAEEMVAYVRRTPGAIALLPEGATDVPVALVLRIGP
jgi:ABC-type phosphate transport system substrate-binding protein